MDKTEGMSRLKLVDLFFKIMYKNDVLLIRYKFLTKSYQKHFHKYFEIINEKNSFENKRTNLHKICNDKIKTNS